jgi:hypothetical protein
MVLALALHPVPLQAATFAQVIVGEGDNSTGISVGFGESSDAGWLPVSTGMVSGDSSHDLSVAGGDGFLVFSGAGSASASIQSLQTTASASVTNSFFDSEYVNDPPQGNIPNDYGTQSLARFTETLQYGGTATAYTSRYIMRLTGTISGEGSYTTIRLTHATAPSQFFYYNTPGTYDLTLTSESFVHGLAPQEFSLEIISAVRFSTEFFPDGSNLSGASNFGNTLELIGIELRDENGTLAPQGTIASGSGATYNIIPVPEPSSLMIYGLSALGLSLRRIRRSK